MEQEKYSFRKDGPLKAVRKPMERGLHWEDEWEEEECLVV